MLTARPILLIALLAAPPVFAQDMIGRAYGMVDGTAFDFPLDCQGWQADERIVYAAGDDRYAQDRNGDGVATEFNHFAPISSTSMSLTLGDVVYYVQNGMGPKEGEGSWDFTDTAAHWAGALPMSDMVEADVTVDCATRGDADRGLTGRVTGTVDGLAIDAALSCDTWGSDLVEVSTASDVIPRVTLRYVAGLEGGSVTLQTENGTYEMIASAMTNTPFVLTEDAMGYAYDLTDRTSGAAYRADLLFSCPAQ